MCVYEYCYNHAVIFLLSTVNLKMANRLQNNDWDAICLVSVHAYVITCVSLLCRYLTSVALSSVLGTSFILAYHPGSTYRSPPHWLWEYLLIASLLPCCRHSTFAAPIHSISLCTVLPVSHGYLQMLPVYEGSYLDYHGHISCHECCIHCGIGN